MAAPTHRLEEAEVKATTVKQTVKDDVNGMEYVATLTFTNRGGAHNLTSFTLSGVGGHEHIQAVTMRHLPLTQMISDARKQLKPKGKPDPSVLLNEKWRGTDAQCQAIADLYRRAITEGVPVQKYIADALGRPLSTVTRYVCIARKRGFLGKANGTRKGEA